MELLKRFMKEEDGLGTVEIVLITVILIGLVLMFKKPIEDMMKKITGKMTENIDKALESPAN